MCVLLLKRKKTQGTDSETIRRLIFALSKAFAIKDLGHLNYFLGLEVTHDETGLLLSQAKYAHDVLTRAIMLDAKAVATLLSTTTAFSPAVKDILRYVKGKLSYGLSFRHSSKPSLIGYLDADWARCLETPRSTYGYSIFLGGNLVSWSAKKQPTVSRSSCEYEYQAIANTAAKIVWATYLLRELHVLRPNRPTILCDNRSAFFLSQNLVSHKQAKHIDLDYHFVHELISSGKLYTPYVPSKLQLAIYSLRVFLDLCLSIFDATWVLVLRRLA
ncbi:uncharacterized protein LOC112529082 [Cynara cardunculus var. scolymus]|uniref:uncharacterized protein LOC112529082 n=1 Tax=Cynara cardunculus var. scolymus TaxID=59895 RepID=UPI000D630DDA|nr:uncharacterized protein LOC112529082 [Cynara cardunculus var. scolymus]